MPRTVTIPLFYQRCIDRAPMTKKQLHRQASANDEVTIDTWRPTWISQIKENHALLGSFKDHGIQRLYKKHQYQPAIVIGSGPSLAVNGAQLADRGEITAVSCLHNYHFFEDRNVHIDYYVSLDSGKVVLEEISEGGQKSPEEYWASTANKTLLAYIGSHPDLFKMWQGKIYVFNCPIPDEEVRSTTNALEHFNAQVSTGGNVLGAATYIAKAIFGCNPVAFMGADFSFSYNDKFHGWDSKYDKDIGECLTAIDVYGMKVKTWQSYFNFKCWFDYVVTQVPGLWRNCTEGGLLGAYPEGNLIHCPPMDLKDFIEQYHVNRHVEQMMTRIDDPSVETKILF